MMRLEVTGRVERTRGGAARCALFVSLAVLAASCGDINAAGGRTKGGSEPTSIPGPPRVVSAVSTGNTSARVVFSEPVTEGSADPGHFSIGQANVNSESAFLPVESATRSDDGVAIALETGSQNEVLYELTASNVRDLDGNLLAAPELLVDPSVTTFAGTPPSAGDGSLVDTDGDGLSDNAETSGWTVTVFLSNGDLRQSTHTSDPMVADTDGDGLDDQVELLAGTNPRSTDTDGDGVGDAEEKNVWRSNPTHQDTDEDGMPDSTELEFDTSPILADTDGDGFGDHEELFELNRDPLVADMPRPQVKVNDYDLQLDVKFSYTNEEGNTENVTKSTSTSVSQARTTSLSRSDTRSVQTTTSFGVEAGFEIGGGTSGFSTKLSTSASFERSTARGFTSTVDRSTATQSQATQERSVSTTLETSERRSVTKSIQGANVRASVNIRNDSDVPFTLANLEISALRQDRRGGGDFRPVATLVPASGDELRLNLGAFDAERGPIIFQNSNIFPSLVEELMREPTGLIFKVANFDVIDEEGRVFAFTSADVASRTAGITIDFGDGRVESTRVATHNRFTPEGRPMGISIARAFELMGYELRVPGEPMAEPFPDPLPPDTRFSIGTHLDDEGVERLIRVGGVQNDFAPADPEKRFWVVRVNDEAVSPDADFSSLQLHAGDEIMLFYTADVDEDGLFEREEIVYGSSDKSTDTDGDELSDYEEVREGWMVEPTPGQPYRAFPSPARSHSDLDELDDFEERAAETDPNRGDTDRDALKDHFEIDGIIRVELADGDNDDSNNVTVELERYNDREIVDGGDEVASTEATGDDVQIVPLGSAVAPGNGIVGPGPDGVLDTSPAEDDFVMANPAIAATGPNVCSTEAQGDDVQQTPVGEEPAGLEVCVRPGPNGVLDTEPSERDVPKIIDGGDGSLWTAADGGDDVQLVISASLVVNGAIIGPGPDGVLDTSPNNISDSVVGDDLAVIDTEVVDGDADVACFTAAEGDDEQRTPVGEAPAEGEVCVRGGLNGTLDTQPVGSDVARTVHDGFFKLDPRKRDTDFDGIPDGRELVIGTNPNVPDRGLVNDSDNDGLTDSEEEGGWPLGGDRKPEEVTSNTQAPDTDGDGLPDVYEFAIGTDPRDDDTDDDTLSDLQEYAGSNNHYDDGAIRLANRRCDAASQCTRPEDSSTETSAVLADSDGDGLNDNEELQGWDVTLADGSSSHVNPDPNDRHSDGDDWDDRVESARGTDPNAPDTDGDGVDDHDDYTFRSDGSVLHDPLRKDKVIDIIGVKDVVVEGDCDGGSDGGDWDGYIRFTRNGRSPVDWHLDNCDWIAEGNSCDWTCPTDGCHWNVTFVMVPNDSITYDACVGGDGDDCTTTSGTHLPEPSGWPDKVTYSNINDHQGITTYVFDEPQEDHCRLDVTQQITVK